MALTITEATNKTFYDYGSTQYPELSMSGSAVGIPYWESSAGIFEDRFNNDTILYPFNEHRLATITARRVRDTQGQFSLNQVNESGAGILTKTAGTNGAWDAAAALTGENYQTGTDLDAFIEVIVNETSTEKAMVMSYTLISAHPDSNDFAWHFLSNGFAVAKRQGVVVSPEVSYKNGDVFRIQKTGTSLKFIKNNEVIVTVNVAGGLNVYSFFAFKTLGATLGKSVFWKSSIEAVATYQIQINAQFPEQPNYSYEINLDNITLSSYMEDGTGVYRLKGMPKRVWSLNFTERPFTEYQTVYDFWMYHQKHLKFYYNDLVYGVRKLVTFDSGLRVQAVGPDRITFSCVVKEV